MRTSSALVLVVAVLVTACGGSTTLLGPLAGGEGDVLSPCAPPGDATTTTLVTADGERPQLADMEAALADSPDAQFIIDEQVADGSSREDAVHAMYAQVVGDALLEDARALPGFVAGAYARPEAGEPFRLSFRDDVPEAFDVGAYELDSYGLEVTTGAAGFDQDAFAVAFEAATELGIRTVSGSGDETTGTGTIEVIDATPEQVAAWEAAVPGSDTICLVRAPGAGACDGPGALDPADELPDVPAVVGEAPNAGLDDDAASAVTDGYLGLGLDAARARGDREGRRVRVIVEDGVELGRDDDLDRSRVNLSVCNDVVVDAVLDQEL